MEVFAIGEFKLTVMDVRLKILIWITDIFFRSPYKCVVIRYLCVNMQDQKVLVTEPGNQATFQGMKIAWIPLVPQRKWTVLQVGGPEGEGNCEMLWDL